MTVGNNIVRGRVLRACVWGKCLAVFLTDILDVVKGLSCAVPKGPLCGVGHILSCELMRETASWLE